MKSNISEKINRKVEKISKMQMTIFTLGHFFKIDLPMLAIYNKICVTICQSK